MAVSKISTSGKGLGIVTQGGEEVVEMGISSSAAPVVTNLLTDLYQDPIKSTIREVMSNAIDAHDGVPTIEVTLPTEFNPVFIVEDHGVGMSPETVKTIYAQYGESQKSVDFTKVGAFGLGAKAPLAYCDSFLVETTHDGVTTTAALSRESGKIFATVSSEETGKDNGTIVTVPVRVDDVMAFHNKFIYHRVPLNANLFVDGKKATSDEWVLVNDELIVDKDSNSRAKIFVNKSAANCAISDFNYYDIVIGGAVYEAQSASTDFFVRAKYGVSDAESLSPILVEINPGVVDFNSSREGIVKNVRFDKINKLISDALDFNKYDNFVKLLTTYTKVSLDSANVLILNKCNSGKLAVNSGKLYFESKEVPLDIFGEKAAAMGELFKSDDKSLVAYYLPDASIASTPRVIYSGNLHVGDRYFSDHKVAKKYLREEGAKSEIDLFTFVSLIANTRLAFPKTYWLNSEGRNVLFIDDVDSESLDKLINNQRGLVNTYGQDGLSIFVTEGKISENLVKTIADNFIDRKVIHESAEAVLTAVASKKKELAAKTKIGSDVKAKLNSSKGIPATSVLMLGNDNWLNSTLRRMRTYKVDGASRLSREAGFSFNRETINEIMTKGDVIVARGKTVLDQLEALAGAVNSGMKIEGKSVFFESRLTTGVHQELVKYEYMIYPTSFDAPSVIVGKYEHKVYSSSVVVKLLNDGSSDLLSSAIQGFCGTQGARNFVNYALGQGLSKELNDLLVNLKFLLDDNIRAFASGGKFREINSASFANVSPLNEEASLAAAFMKLSDLKQSSDVDESSLARYMDALSLRRVEGMSRYDSVFFNDALELLVKEYKSIREAQ